MEKTITDFLNEENRNYSLYVLEQRAIPSVIDGLKTTQRKVLDCAKDIWKTGKNERFKKIYQLAGLVADSKNYHHSNVALEDTIIGMGQNFKNNLLLFDTEGQWGFLRVPEAGAARYIGCSLNQRFYEVFKDFNLLKNKIDEGKEIEPEYFLPIIPMILINGSQGIAVGFASKILNRDPKRIIDVCIKILNEEKFNNSFKPLLNEFNGKIEQDSENPLKWNFYGSYEKLNSTTIKITEFSPEMTFEKIEKKLIELEDKKQIISYENNSKERINIIVKFKKEFLDTASEGTIHKLFDLDGSVTENLTVLDSNGKIKVFNNIIEIIDYFIKFRMNFYFKRKQLLIDNINKELILLNNKSKFIKMLIDKKLIINNISKENVIKKLEILKFDKINDSFSYLLNLPLLSLTKELFEKIIKDVELKLIELDNIKNKDEKMMYIEDLQNLKNKL